MKKLLALKESKPILWNMIIFAVAMVISQTAIESFNVTSTLFTLKTTGSVWLTVLVQAARYLPTLIAFGVAPIIIKKINNKSIIVVSEYVSAILIFFVAVVAFSTEGIDYKDRAITPLIIVIYIAIIIWNIFNSARFLALKNIVYRISEKEENINIYNRINNFATSISYLVAALVSLGLVSLVPFPWICVILGIFYIISQFLYSTLIVYKHNVEISSKPQIKKHSKTIIYTLSILVLLAIFSSITFVPRFGTNTQFMINLFLEIKNSPDVEFWVSIYLIVIGAALCFGSLAIFLLGKKILISTSVIYALITIALAIFFVFAFGGLGTNVGLFGKIESDKGVDYNKAIFDQAVITWAHKNKAVMLSVFLIVTFIQYFVFSMFLPVYFDYSYRTVPSDKYAFFAALTMIIFQLMGLIFTVIITVIFNKINFQSAYLFYAVIVGVFVIAATVLSFVLKARQIKFTKDHHIKAENELL
ncbi:hypothetical protein V2E24_01435 [Mycoplasmopsis ciconiae]|uniref:MFS transporter n=1 Tax=Mycoplasmopsis ciconiae TaxID=561067 RepID=A0ABU7MLU4_9BACT|nr:hypothetical protein [Mycoplasmopsis ciconiae]